MFGHDIDIQAIRSKIGKGGDLLMQGKPYAASRVRHVHWWCGDCCALGVHAEQPAMPVIGFLSSRSANDSARQVDAFRGALREAGFIEGKDIAIDHSWADGQYDRLPRQAADLVDRTVAVIFTTGPAAHAAKAATTAIPIVFFVIGERSHPLWPSCQPQQTGR